MAEFNVPLSQLTEEDVDFKARALKPQYSPLRGAYEQFRLTSNVTSFAKERLELGAAAADEFMRDQGLNLGPASKTVAEIKAEIKADDDSRKAIIQNINPYSSGSTAFPILGSLAKGVADPIGLGVASLIGKGALTAGTYLANKGIAQQTIRGVIASETVSGIVGKEVASNILENTITDPIIGLVERDLGRKYSAEDFAISTGAAAILGGLSGALRTRGLRANKTRLDPDSVKADIELTLNQLEFNTRPLLEYNTRALQKQDFDFRPTQKSRPTPNVRPPSAAFSGKFEGGAFYSAHTPTNGQISVSNNNVIANSYGKGIYLTDNPNLSANMAAKTINMKEGQVAKFDIDKLNNYDLDASMSPNLKEDLLDVVKEEFSAKEVEAITQSGTSRELFDYVDHHANANNDFEMQDALNNVLINNGFNGITFGVKSPGTSGVGAAKGMFIFDVDKLNEGLADIETVKATTADRPDINDDVEAFKRDMNRKENTMFYDPEDDAMYTEWSETPPEYDLAETTSELSELVEDLNLTDEGFNEVSAQKIKEDMEIRSPEKIREVSKAAEFCLRNS